MFTATASGLFADQSLDVEILGPPRGPDNVWRVAVGEADFCLTSVHHYLTARSEWDDLDAQFAAVIVQRSPVAALVRADSPLVNKADLAGSKVGGTPQGPQMMEFLHTLEQAGIQPSSISHFSSEQARSALAEGQIEVIPGLADTLPRAARLAGVPLRAIPLELDVYASGLVAGEHVDADLVWRLRRALASAFEQQRREPESGLAYLCGEFPETVTEEAIRGWHLLEPYVFAGWPVGEMRQDRWRHTLAHLRTARGLTDQVVKGVYRDDFVEPVSAYPVGVPAIP